MCFLMIERVSYMLKGFDLAALYIDIRMTTSYQCMLCEV